MFQVPAHFELLVVDQATFTIAVTVQLTEICKNNLSFLLLRHIAQSCFSHSCFSCGQQFDNISELLFSLLNFSLQIIRLDYGVEGGFPWQVRWLLNFFGGWDDSLGVLDRLGVLHRSAQLAPWHHRIRGKQHQGRLLIHEFQVLFCHYFMTTFSRLHWTFSSFDIGCFDGGWCI